MTWIIGLDSPDLGREAASVALWLVFAFLFGRGSVRVRELLDGAERMFWLRFESEFGEFARWRS